MDLNAEVIATFGRHLLLGLPDGSRRMARPMGRNATLVCGDRVRYVAGTGDELLVENFLPRTTLLRRSSLRGLSEPLAANLSQLAIVLAPVPAPDFFMIDRYICAAECANLRALIVLNKCELPQAAALAADLRQYTEIGYTLVSLSAHECQQSSETLAPLRAALLGQTSVFAGQSGVGKSSLTRLLTQDDSDIAVGDLMREKEGRHTTTASRLYNCPDAGRVMDSPGVRDFAPAIDDLERTTLGFREIVQLASKCRFQDCKHMQEPQCAVRQAVETAAMHPRRYESYRRLRRLYDDLWEKRPPGERARSRS
jgi:ribosome biogenesis GTPase / thiamine phosphate phosphatase